MCSSNSAFCQCISCTSLGDCSCRLREEPNAKIVFCGARHPQENKHWAKCSTCKFPYPVDYVPSDRRFTKADFEAYQVSVIATEALVSAIDGYVVDLADISMLVSGHTVMLSD